MLFKNAVSPGFADSSFCCCLRIYGGLFWAESQFSTLDCMLWMELCFGPCCKEISEAFMCPGECPKHYTRGDLNFLMWCDRPSHWTLLKGVNVLLGRHIVSLLSDNKLMTVYSPSGNSYWACSHIKRDLLRLPSVIGRLDHCRILKQFFFSPIRSESHVWAMTKKLQRQ